ncbi:MULTISPECIES: DUF397 domain-containing protein [Streptomyces]|uniref:Toxin n=1 Tax=Streptomyces spororaveus TaxID=284039 RepID=A0ABQ3TDP3_9ACTN|nr:MULTISPECIES: DUF397 domain-containing protein [Streptomyces]MCM9081066.1 DUF397 domain-containing protein [Streptomyces spororaveus]MCX5304487.1 DUF397 domain-containing protein [Streptomyces sp. NBC_00160]GHI78543.1 toxin [Streptomyces spororaveus]
MSTDLKWFKSSYSGGDGDACLEVAVAWHKSSYSTSDGDNCVEVASGRDTVHVRDSKSTDGPVLDLAPASWAALTGWVSR